MLYLGWREEWPGAAITHARYISIWLGCAQMCPLQSTACSPGPELDTCPPPEGGNQNLGMCDQAQHIIIRLAGEADCPPGHENAGQCGGCAHSVQEFVAVLSAAKLLP